VIVVDFDPADENAMTGFRQNWAELVSRSDAAHPCWQVIESVLEPDLPSVFEDFPRWSGRLRFCGIMMSLALRQQARLQGLRPALAILHPSRIGRSTSFRFHDSFALRSEPPLIGLKLGRNRLKKALAEH
jgi:hypothetical protein